MGETVVFFERYPFETGQKIRISDGPRKGDWKVIDVDEKKVKLQCPVSGFVAHWDRFCYLTEERESVWPSED